MKARYVIYTVLVMLALAGCRKNNFNKDNINITPVKGGGKGPTPPGGVTTAHLNSFKINGAICAYDSVTNAYYYPVATGTSLGNFTVSFDTTTLKPLLLITCVKVTAVL
jgi:hypothetical protein